MDAADPRPSVIASHVDIVFRVYAKGTGGGGWRTRARRGVREVHAVKDVSFVANHGESIGIIGRNGSGKSTLLRAVAGLVPPTSGEVWADGTPSLLGVNAVLVKQLSGARNIYLGAQALGLAKAEVDALFDEIVDFSGIGEAIHLPMSTYSSGMAARLRFAISTAAVPSVLVIDEALATGDAHFRARSQERIEQLRGRAGTVFLVSHSAATIKTMCDRALWLDQGTLLMDGPVDEVVDAYSAAAEKSLGTTRPSQPLEPDVPGVDRWSGSTRYHTSAVASRRGTSDRYDTVLLATGADLPLALSAVPASTGVGVPVLLGSPRRLMPVTRKEILRLGASRVVLLGADGLVDGDVASALAEEGIAVDRVEGTDRIELSLALNGVLEAQDHVGTMVLASEDDAPGVLAAVLSAEDGDGRVLLVDPDVGVSRRHLDVLRRVSPRRVVVAGDAGLIGDADLERLQDLAPEGATRMVSVEPVRVAADAAERFSPEQVDTVYVSSSEPAALGDAVTGAAVAGLSGAPLLLVDRDEIPTATHTQLERLAPSRVVVLGGPQSVAPDVRRALAGYLRSARSTGPEAEGDLDL